MSELTDRIAAKHRDDRLTGFCLCGAEVPWPIGVSLPTHIAAVTEAAVREQVAQDLDAAHSQAAAWVAEEHLSAWQAALASAARIARGDNPKEDTNGR